MERIFLVLISMSFAIVVMGLIVGVIVYIETDVADKLKHEAQLRQQQTIVHLQIRVRGRCSNDVGIPGREAEHSPLRSSDDSGVHR